jgi:heme-degrading monooxygenase HmoA
MWIRIGSFPVKPGCIGRLRDVYNREAVPRVRGQPGNVACLLLEPASGEGAYKAITIWSSRQAGEAYDASGTAAEIVALVRECFAGPPTLEAFESSSVDGLDGARPLTGT